MEITSLNFVVFLPVVLIIYYLLPRRAQNVWLLLVSYAFYATWAWELVLILALLTGANFALAQRLRMGDGQARRDVLWLGIVLNVAALLYFRSAAFFAPNAVALFDRLGITMTTGSESLLAALGLSFYALQLISYLVDVYRGQLAAETDLLDFALYLVYFPKLLAGPIERARDFLPKLKRPRLVDNAVLTRSLTLIIIGAARKMFIADTLTAFIPWDVFEQPANFAAPELWGWLVVYAFALYNDFAGYTSLVRGISGLFGIELSANFNFPYFARSFSEFWNRWHITLSHWLRDYIYFPLSRALLRRSPGRRNLLNLVFPPLVTMLVSGLWHGLSWHMLLWGGLHGLYQVFERVPTFWRPPVPAQKRPAWRQAVAMIVVFILVTLAWVPFRLEIPLALDFWQALFTWTGFTIRYRRIFLAIPFLLLIILLDWLQYRAEDELVFLRWPRPAQAMLLALAMLLFLILIQADEGEPFIYQAF